jgi:hypothetical protein
MLLVDDDDSVHEVVLAACPMDAPQEDYARLIRDCNDFCFTELSPLDAAAMPPPQKLYEGESGLKRGGVWNLFMTPFEAFRSRQGWLYRRTGRSLVDKNSNK